MRLHLTGLTPVRLDDSSRTSIQRSVICSYPYRHMPRNLEGTRQRKRPMNKPGHPHGGAEANQSGQQKGPIVWPALARIMCYRGGSHQLCIGHLLDDTADYRPLRFIRVFDTSLFRAGMEPGAVHPRRTVPGLNLVNPSITDLPLDIFPEQEFDFLS